VAFVFILALLLDSTCAAACISGPRPSHADQREDCSKSHHGGDKKSCDLHGHLKPVVKDRTAPTATDAPASLPSAIDSFELAPRDASFFDASILHPPPLLRPSSILRI
jgi:hypothetical protein